MNIIIQKFGGTSVATQQRREMVADKIIDAISKGYSPVVVVSAIGRKGDPYATDTLLSLINNSESHVSKREMDLLMSCGEIISAVVIGETLEKRKLKVKVLTGGQAGIITNNDYSDADIIKVETKKILDLIKDGIIPVVAGFQGVTEGGDITTIGRGGSDVTGSVLGEALKADFIEIYTDVDGIMTADPRIVSEAKVIDKISYDEVFQFADQGAKVIHPRAIEYAMRGNVPLIIKNTMTNAPGTIITAAKNTSNRIVTGITHMSNRIQISVTINKMGSNDLFIKLAENGLSIDLINVFPRYKVFTVDGADGKKAEKILQELNIDYSIINNCCKVAVIGNGMRGIPGVMAKILMVLEQNHIEVLQTADSHTTIWCLVNEEDTGKAINVLHRAFGM
ncbi:MAG: aspartate kinase [Clostridiales bacterium]|nr:aspartate kinase [Clostridiales bacterium]